MLSWNCTFIRLSKLRVFASILSILAQFQTFSVCQLSIYGIVRVTTAMLILADPKSPNCKRKTLNECWWVDHLYNNWGCPGQKLNYHFMALIKLVTEYFLEFFFNSHSMSMNKLGRVRTDVEYYVCFMEFEMWWWSTPPDRLNLFPSETSSLDE